MSDNDFVQGLKLETKEGEYGEYIKGSINVESIFNNPLNNKVWLNFNIFKSKSGSWYAKIIKPKGQETVSFNKIDEDEIPF